MPRSVPKSYVKMRARPPSAAGGRCGADSRGLTVQRLRRDAGLRTGLIPVRVRAEALEAGVFGVVAGICALLVSLRPLNFLSDDALFYLVIARHIAAGDGSTFNGLFPTN